MPRAYPEMVRQSLAAAPGVAGDLTLGAAVSGYAALKAAHDGATVNVSLRDGQAWEVRRDCIYDHDTLTLTRGTLVDSSTGAAVDLGAGTIMTVARTGHEARRLPLADMDVDGNALRVVDANGNKFALLPLDANDQVLANIGHRQNTLANLLTLDGVPGEISVATDVNALVAHTGVAGQAKEYRRDTLIARADCFTTNSGSYNNVPATVALSTVHGSAGIIDNVNEIWTIPAGAYWQRLTVSGRIAPQDINNIPEIGDIWKLFCELETSIGSGVYAEQYSLGGFHHYVDVADHDKNLVNFSWSSLVYVGASNGIRGRLRVVGSNAALWCKTFSLRLGLEFYSQL